MRGDRDNSSQPYKTPSHGLPQAGLDPSDSGAEASGAYQKQIIFSVGASAIYDWSEKSSKS